MSILETLWLETFWAETLWLETVWPMLSFLETLWPETFWAGFLNDISINAHLMIFQTFLVIVAYPYTDLRAYSAKGTKNLRLASEGEERDSARREIVRKQV